MWWETLLLQPHAVVLPGDMFDEGKLCSDAQHGQLLQRFEAVFSAHKTDHWHVMLPFTSRSIPLVITVGNHDQPAPPPPGYLAEHVEAARLRSEIAFGKDSCTCVRGHVFRTIDTSSVFYDVPGDEGGKLACDGLACAQHSTGASRHHVIVTHVPLFRRSDSVCGKERGPGGGVTYIARDDAMVVGEDVLAERDSLLLMQTARADAHGLGREVSVVLSGHTHAPCFFASPALSSGGSGSGSGSVNMSSIDVLHATLSASGWRMRPDASCALLLLHDRAADGSRIDLLPLPHEYLCIAVVAAACAATVAAAYRLSSGAWRLKRRKES